MKRFKQLFASQNKEGVFMTEAERISKYWTDTYTQEQFGLCGRRCFRRIECYSSNMLTFKDGSGIIFWEDGKWEVQI